MKPEAPSLSAHLLAEARRFSLYPNLVRRGRLGADLNDAVLLPLSAAPHLGFVAKAQVLPLHQLLDEYFSKKLVAEVPEYVDRTRQLEPLSANSPVPRQVRVYLEQASWSFVLGLWDGAIALSRACLEEVLEDKVGHYVGRGDRKLNDWLAEAGRKRLLNQDQLSRARVIQEKGNVVLHERSADAREAEQVVSALRTFLAVAYK